MSDTYNGWTNYATWRVSAWGDIKSKQGVEYIRDILEEQHRDMPDGILKDMIDLDEINWDELSEYFDEDEEEVEQ